jgi:hypothetical protein
MSRAPFVMPKAGAAFTPRQRGLRHHHRLALREPPKMKAAHGTDSMPETADNVAADYGVSRADQDAFAARSQARWAAAQAAGVSSPTRSCRWSVPQRKGDPRHRRHRRTPAPRHHSPSSPAEGRERPRPHGDRGQCQRRERWRGGAAAGLGRRPRPRASRPSPASSPWQGGGRGAPRHGHRPGPGGAQGAGQDRADASTRWT